MFIIEPGQFNMKQWKSMAEQVLGPDFFQDFYKGQTGGEPYYNLYRSSAEIVVLINLPYIKNVEQVKIYVQGEELIIKGSLDYGYRHLEAVVEQLFSGSFEKRISLPSPVNTKRVNAQYKRGLLIVQLFPKLRVEGRQISIHENKE